MRHLGWFAAGAVAVSALLGAPHDAAAAGKKFVVGVSNTLIGNGWREEMICSIKAQAKASGIVSKVILANRNGGPPEQIADLRNLISAGVNAIIVNPSEPRRAEPGDQAGGRARHRRGRGRSGGDARRKPMSCPTTRWRTANSARNGCSSSCTARATWWRCAASTACPRTRTGMRGSPRR